MNLTDIIALEPEVKLYIDKEKEAAEEQRKADERRLNEKKKEVASE